MQRLGHQNRVWPKFPADPSNINSGAVIYVRASIEDLHLNNNQGFIEKLEALEQQASAEAKYFPEPSRRSVTSLIRFGL